MNWHAERFDEGSGRGRIRFDCVVCERPMWFPPTKAGKYKTCGEACSQELRAGRAAAKVRQCAVCGASFSPRPSQVGKYCSVGCSIQVAMQHARTPEVFAKIAVSLKAAYRAGKLRARRGDRNPQWTGGKRAWRHRNRASIALAAKMRRLRNPEAAREAVRRRRGKVRVGPLPKGTIARLGMAQRWRCAVCRINIRRAYHMDHIIPLALDGEHAPGNLQLLCPPCNMHKNAKDPIVFMQERGFLL